MLSARERRFLSENIQSSDHDYFTWAPLSGEPILHGSTLCYYDGACVEVVGVPVGPRRFPRDERAELNDVIARWSGEPSVAAINYYGPYRLAGPSPEEWRVECAEGPRRWNRDVFVDLGSSLLQRRKTRQDVRRAERAGVRVSARRAAYLGHEHISMLDALARRGTLELADLLYVTNVVAILKSSATTMFEARVHGKLVGFAVGHNYFRHTAFMVVAAFDHACRGCSDRVYSAVLRYYQERGARELGLGYATDRGLLHYKSKWGTVRLGPPVHQFTWERRSRADLADDCLHWSWRFVARLKNGQ
jgi:hypothetical protein